MRKPLIVLLSLGLILLFGLACGSGSQADVKTVGLHQSVTVGKAEWKVLNVEKTKQVESQTGGEGARAEGQFVFVEAQVKNIGHEVFVLTGVEIEIVDSENRHYEFDSRHNTIFLSSIGKENLIKGNLQPGETARGWVAFDVNEDAKELKAKVRDLDVLSEKYALVNLDI